MPYDKRQPRRNTMPVTSNAKYVGRALMTPLLSRLLLGLDLLAVDRAAFFLWLRRRFSFDLVTSAFVLFSCFRASAYCVLALQATCCALYTVSTSERAIITHCGWCAVFFL